MIVLVYYIILKKIKIVVQRLFKLGSRDYISSNSKQYKTKYDTSLGDTIWDGMVQCVDNGGFAWNLADFQEYCLTENI